MLSNTLTANDEYFRSNRKIVLLQIQMQLSKKLKALRCSFIAFLQPALIFEDFKKGIILIA